MVSRQQLSSCLTSTKRGGKARLTHTGQRVAELRVVDELPVVEPGHAVQVETVQADHVAVVALENQDRAPARRKADMACGSSEGGEDTERPGGAARRGRQRPRLSAQLVDARLRLLNWKRSAKDPEHRLS